MEEGASNRPDNTPEGSVAGDENNPQSSASKNQATKDRKCQYCHQAFTSSSLGRHLDQFLFKKKPDGIHDVEEIRRIRSGITRRQARTSSVKHDTPDRSTGKGQLDPYHGGDSDGKSRDGGIRMMFNTPTWHATGVINDIPNPNQTQDGMGPSRFTSQSRSGSMHLPDYASRGANASNPDTVRALELALREVLDNIKAATSRLKPRVSPFDFEVQSQTFPSLCLLLLPPPASLFSASPFSSHNSFPLEPPGGEHLEIVRQALRAKIGRWQSEQLSSESAGSPQSGRLSMGLEPTQIRRNAQQHEDISVRHLELAYKHWSQLPQETQRESWQLEITRAFARELEKRKSLDEQLARVQQEADQLRSQVERLGSCQWPREFALFPPDTLPLPRDVAKELDSKESQISPDSPRWDYDSVVAKWKRVVMHDRSMGRVGVGHTNTGIDDHGSAEKVRAGDDSRAKPLQPPPALSPGGGGPSPSGPSSSSQQASPYMHQDANHSPNEVHQSKRPRLMNGTHGPQGANHSSANQGAPASNTNTWNHPPQPPVFPHLAGSNAPTPTPPSSNNGGT